MLGVIQHVVVSPEKISLLDSILCSTMYGLHFTVYSVQCTVYSVQCTAYSVQCTLLNLVHCLYVGSLRHYCYISSLLKKKIKKNGI